MPMLWGFETRRRGEVGMEQAPLFERLGGRDGVYALMKQVLENHLANPVVGTRFQHARMTRPEMLEGGAEFFCTGLSGVPTYTGRPARRGGHERQ
jgi:hemoglobin